jgi:hypothetical protein
MVRAPLTPAGTTFEADDGTERTECVVVAENVDVNSEYRQTYDELESAVRKFNAVNQHRSGAMTGFVLFTASSRFDDDGDMLFAYDYMMSLGINMFTGIGLVEIGTLRMKTDINSAYEGQDLRHEGEDED